MNECFAMVAGLVSSALLCMILLLRIRLRDLENRINNLKKDFYEKHVK